MQRAGVSFELTLPHQRFNRKFGVYSTQRFSPQGESVDEAIFNAKCNEWLPNPADRAQIHALMIPVRTRGKIAGWIAPPARGINSLPALDFEYVRV